MDKEIIVKEKALELNYENCGIINILEIDDYAEKLDNRIKQFPWAKSIIICVRRYGKYYIPENLRNLIGKLYLTDGRIDEHSPDYRASVEFEKFLNKLGLQTATKRKIGLTVLR